MKKARMIHHTLLGLLLLLILPVVQIDGTSQEEQPEPEFTVNVGVVNPSKTDFIVKKNLDREHTNLLFLEEKKKDEVQRTHQDIMNRLEEVALRNQRTDGRSQNVHLLYLGASQVLTSRKKQTALQKAVRNVVETGTTIVVPAGDQRRAIRSSVNNSMVVPAAYSETITVASFTLDTDPDPLMYPKNNVGPEIDLYDPAVTGGTRASALDVTRRVVNYVKEAYEKSGNIPGSKTVLKAIHQQTGETEVIATEDGDRNMVNWLKHGLHYQPENRQK